MIICVCVAVGLAAEGALLGLVIRSERQPPIETPADVMIVLGAKVEPDGTLSNTLEFRVQAAADAYRAGLAPVMIVCGAQGRDEPQSEASAMRDYLISRYPDIPAEAVIVEDQSFDTKESIQNARHIMESRGFQTAIAVTSNYHIQRTLWLCRDAGLDMVGGIGSRASLYPYTHWKMRLRETLSWVKYYTLDKGTL